MRLRASARRRTQHRLSLQVCPRGFQDSKAAPRADGQSRERVASEDPHSSSEMSLHLRIEFLPLRTISLRPSMCRYGTYLSQPQKGDVMSYRIVLSLAGVAILSLACVSTDADARGGRAGGVRAGGFHGGGVRAAGINRGGAYRSGAVRAGAYRGVAGGGAYRAAAYRGGVYRGGVYRGGVYRGGVYRGGNWNPG